MYAVRESVCVRVRMNKASSSCLSSATVPFVPRVHLLQWKRGWERLARLEEHVIWSWPSASSCGPVALGFRVARNRCWNAVTVTEGPTHSPHCESKPKLHFIRLLSLQRLSHHSINTPLSPLQICFPSFFCTHENAQGPFQLSDVALYFVRWCKKPHNSGSFWILKHSLTEHKGSEVF